MFKEVLNHLNFAELVEKSTKLTLIGGNKYRGLSPFTNEKTPSFFIDNDAKTWFDFSSHQGGGVLDFISLVEKLDRHGAMLFLQDYVGVHVEENKPSEVLYSALSYFLKRPKKAYEYMASRGFSQEVCEKYEIGYCDNGLYAHLSKDFSKEDLEESGLCGDGYSLFRNRVMIPVRDVYGRLVSFSGRSLGGEQPKYLHGHVTPLFKKSSILWNLDKVRKLAMEEQRLILCEGQLDALAISEVGFPAVAVLGASLSEEQVKVLNNIAPSVYLMFDSDAAGMNALLKSFDVLGNASECVLYAVGLPAGKDPAEVAQETPGLIRDMINDAIPDTTLLVRSLIQKYSSSRLVKNRAHMVRAVIRALKPYLSKSYTYRSLDLLERAAQELGLDSGRLSREFGLFSQSFPNMASERRQTLAIESAFSLEGAPIYEKRILYEVINNPSRLLQLEKVGVSPSDFSSRTVFMALECLSPSMDSEDAMEAIKGALSEEQYYDVLSFFSLGLPANDFDAALRVFLIKTKERTTPEKIDFLGRKVPDAEINELRRSVRVKLGYDKL